MKNFIVTGASKGIGLATTLSLLKKGHRVFAVGRSEHLLKNIVDHSAHEHVLPIVADLSKKNGINEVVNIVQAYARIDGLVNNAGFLIKKSFKKLTLDDWRQQFELNFFSIVDLIHSLLPLFNKHAHIVNIGSMSGFQGSVKFNGLSAYGASKAALANLTETLAIELHPDEIAVNCLALGAVSTDMQKTAFPNYDAEVTPEMMGDFISNFVLTYGNLFNGKILPISLNNPI